MSDYKINWTDLNALLPPQVNEEEVTKYKNFFKEHCRHLNDKIELINELENLCQRFTKLEPPASDHIKSSQYFLIRDSIRVLRKYFKEEVTAVFKKEFPNPPLSIEGYDHLSNGQKAFKLVADAYNSSIESRKQKWNHKTNYLRFIQKVIETNGLHPDVFKRNPPFSKKFNLLIHYYDRKDEECTECKILISSIEFEQNFTTPYKNQKPIRINGRFIKFEQIEKVKITTTLLNEDEIELYALQKGFRWQTNKRYHSTFLLNCIDETDKYLPDPYTDSKIQETEQKPSEEDQLLKDIILTCSQLQGLKKGIVHDEDSRNGFIAQALENLGYTTKDQPKWGVSATGKRAGEIDIKIQNKEGRTLSICECFNLSSCDKTVIKLHLNKIFNYDANGVKRNYIIVYSESKNFLGLWERYLVFVNKMEHLYPLKDKVQDVSSSLSPFTDIKVAVGKHIRNNATTELFHIFVNMYI